MKKANLKLLHGHRLASSPGLSITKILKNSRDEVKKTSKLRRLARRSFPLSRQHTNCQQDKVVKRDRFNRAISSNKSISEST